MQLSKISFRCVVLTVVLAVLIGPSSAQTPERFNQVVQPYADAQMFMGSVLVARKGKITFSKSYGMADLEWNVPNSSTTRFNIASVTKQFTAASILLLEEHAKLRTDDLVKKFFPDAPPSWDKITIYHLLTHTSGISNAAATYEPGPPEKLVLHDAPLNFQPGERWDYTNLGYLVLGYLVEKISGQSYEEFVRENIFKPLGMKDSGQMSFVTVIPRRATGYWPGNNGIENAERFDPRSGFSTGSIYSSTEDLFRWEEGLFGGKLLSPASLRKMTTPFKSDYGCGLYIHRVNGRLIVEHDGNNIGFNAMMAYYPEEKLAIIVLANLNGTVTGEMTKALAAIAHGEAPPIASVHKEITLPKGALARYAGTYRFQQYSLRMVPEGNHLLVKFDNGFTLAVFPESETEFFSKPWPTRFRFSQNDGGEFTVLTRYDGKKEEKGTKEPSN